ncbi:Mu-like prophage major head subunit gpT family protein [Micavibrio aeruginosavorus]|uniref:Mu-like prophage major head subunit gpT family protein n=1 Tax=Micavibrio aeruginosavorus TaxID=349221 RepID=UPI003F4A8719
MNINRQNLEGVRAGFTSLYTSALSSAKPQWSKVAMEVNSTSAEEKYGWLGSSTRFSPWLGERVLQNLKEHDFAIKNVAFENTVPVLRDNIEDDKLGTYKPMFEMLGHDAAMHPDELVFGLLKNGFSKLCYDGQYFFDTDHPVLDENKIAQSVSNFGGGAGAAWFLLDVSKPVRPIIFQKRRGYEFVAMDDPKDSNVFNRREFVYGVDARVNAGYGLWQLAYGSKQTLDETNYGSARAAMQSFKGDNGRPLNVTPNLLVVGPSNETAARKLLAAENLANGETNIHRNTAEILVVPYL